MKCAPWWAGGKVVVAGEAATQSGGSITTSCRVGEDLSKRVFVFSPWSLMTCARGVEMFVLGNVVDFQALLLVVCKVYYHILSHGGVLLCVVCMSCSTQCTAVLPSDVLPLACICRGRGVLVWIECVLCFGQL